MASQELCKAKDTCRRCGLGLGEIDGGLLEVDLLLQANDGERALEEVSDLERKIEACGYRIREPFLSLLAAESALSCGHISEARSHAIRSRDRSKALGVKLFRKRQREILSRLA